MLLKHFMKNKRGEDPDPYSFSSKWFYYIVALFLIMFTIILYVGNGLTILDAKAATSEFLGEDILIAQLVNVCFSYEERVDGNTRTYQNLIDTDKLNEIVLKDCTDESVYVTVSSEYFDDITVKAGTSTPKKPFSRYVLARYEGEIYPATITVIA